MMRERQARGTCIAAVCAASLLAACGEEPPPPSPNEFMENRILLEATVVRCSQNRAEARYDAECINAREAVNRLAAAEEQARRQDLEAQSERKRQALRRAQEAAAEARRRALEEEQRQRDAELLGEFEPLPDNETRDPTGDQTDIEPGRAVPPAGDADPGYTGTTDGDNVPDDAATPAPLPRSAAGPIPDAAAPEGADGGSTADLEEIRRELERRRGESGDETQQ